MATLSELLKDLTSEEKFRKLVSGFLDYVINDKDERKAWRIWHALSMRLSWSEKCKLLDPWFDGNKEVLQTEVENLLARREESDMWDYLN